MVNCGPPPPIFSPSPRPMNVIRNFSYILFSWWGDLRREVRTGWMDLICPRPILSLLLVLVGSILILRQLAVGPFSTPVLTPDWYEEPILITGVIVSQPDNRPSGAVLLLKGETIQKLLQHESKISVRAMFQIKVSGDTETPYQPNDRLDVIGRLQKGRPVRIPGTFDYSTYLANQGVPFQVFAGKHSVKNLGPAKKISLKRWGWALHEYITDVFSKHLQPEEAAVLAGLTVGDRPRFFPNLKRVFVESGTMHVLVASGSNVAFVLFLWFFCARSVLRLPHRWALGTSIGWIWGYVMVVGMDPPILRAGVMATVMIIFYLCAREDHPIVGLVWAAAIILIIQPGSLFDVGCRMSFCTVFGLLVFMPRFTPLINGCPRFLHWILFLALATLTAQIWLWPINAAVFKRFYPVSVIANLAVIPWAAGGLAAGLILIGMDFIHRYCLPIPLIFDAVQKGTGLYLDGLIAMTRFFAEHSGGPMWLKGPSGLWTCGYYLGCVSLASFPKRALAKAGMIIAGILLLWGWAKEPKPTQLNRIAFVWIDVGRTASLYIQFPDKTGCLIASEPLERSGAFDQVVQPFLAERGVHRIVYSIDLTSGTAVIKGSQSLTGIPFYLKKFPAEKVNRISPVFISTCGINILISDVFPLRLQQAVMDSGIHRIDVIQGRFPKKQLWRDRFVNTYKPQLLIETGFTNETRPSYPPWERLTPTSIQRLGWYEWSPGEMKLSTPFPKEMNRNKSADKTAGVRPPSHAPHFSAHRSGTEHSDAVDGLR